MKRGIFFIFFMLLISFNVFADYDMSEFADEEATFIISADTIEIQKDQTEIEKQSILKETQYRIKLEVLRLYINDVWSLFTSTFIMTKDIIVGFVILIFLRFFVFVFVDFVPLILKRTIDIVSRWIN